MAPLEGAAYLQASKSLLKCPHHGQRTLRLNDSC